MNAYNEKLYDFLVKEENFEPFTEIVKQYEFVRIKLLTDFWLEVEEELKAQPVQPWLSWYYLDATLNSNASKVGYYHEEYWSEEIDSSSCMVIFDRLSSAPIFGLWFSRDTKLQNLDFAAVLNEVKLSHRGWKPGPNGWNLAAYRETGDDFNKPDNLIKILPQNRKTVVSEYVSHLVTAVNELSELGYKYAKKFQ